MVILSVAREDGEVGSWRTGTLFLLMLTDILNRYPTLIFYFCNDGFLLKRKNGLNV